MIATDDQDVGRFVGATGKFTAAGNMTRIRHKHEAVLLADGRVLIAGGSDERDGQGAYANAEIYDPASGSFLATTKRPSRKLFCVYACTTRHPQHQRQQENCDLHNHALH